MIDKNIIDLDRNNRLPLSYFFLIKIENKDLKELNVNRRFGESTLHNSKMYIRKSSFKPITVFYKKQ